MTPGIVPPFLLDRLASTDDPRLARAAAAARKTLTVPRPARHVRTRLRLSIDEGALVAEAVPAPDRVISDAGNTERLPGRRVRTEDDGPTGDRSVDEAYDGLGATFDFFWDAFSRDGIDGAGGSLLATVHFGEDYDNAFWNGERMVFGDGDGDVFIGFTRSLSVIAHELGHGVTEAAGGLEYQGQSGALNESLSDVFGALAEQHALGQTADEATWLVGAGIFTDAVQGTALRSMSAPGTAYDDDVLGKDPQPGHMRDYVETSDDNGGVHINSGIPNRAFFLVATRLGGFAWERAGLVWYRTLTSGTLSPTADFAAFAAATRATAAAEYGEKSEEVDAVRAAWAGVGVAEDATA
ncbi:MULTISPECIES: M4 family metallopeptidase [unclassified Microbacterium]|uniref:M4 family metallopeptidase n=1 Tax=unclassified Microbacterium TaxID=2609290 RepID=UPI00097C4F36|nr:MULTISPECIES: M4 family metallopeptidase [unclassified Microbacterium]MDI9892160.1 M4 family metallopeptidase [Microbacterium sp. IEGM 1404]MXS74860.1 M4 family metallopeptidase [Microbacterium sp. TL13]ONI65700.1 peptidase M4 family protein [Microbacterium sp. CSI-V]